MTVGSISIAVMVIVAVLIIAGVVVTHRRRRRNVKKPFIITPSGPDCYDEW